MRQGEDIREIDAAVERVLAGLREVEPREGLEHRVRSALLYATEEQVAAGGRGWNVWVWAVAVGVVVVAIMPIVWQRYRAPVAVTRPANSAQRMPDGGVQRQVAVEEVRAGSIKAGAARPRIDKTAVASLDPVKDGLVAISSREIDQRALEEARAPSQPTPPEPPTAEERRLMNIATQGTAEQQTALNSEEREAKYEAAKADVMRFFEPQKQKKEEQE